MHILKEQIPSYEELQSVLRKAVIANEIFPVMTGSALKNKGVQLVLDAVVDYLPSPADLPPVKGIDPNTDAEVERKPTDDEPFCALAFKLQTDPFVGTAYILPCVFRCRESREATSTTQQTDRRNVSDVSCVSWQTSVQKLKKCMQEKLLRE